MFALVSSRYERASLILTSDRMEDSNRRGLMNNIAILRRMPLAFA
jgi:hypothetical protein